MNQSKLFIRIILSIVLISTPTITFAKDKVLKFRLSTIQSKIPTNFVAYEPSDSVFSITLAPEKTISDKFNKLHKDKHNIAFLLFDGDALVVEEYNHKVSAATPLYMYSITKSFTGLLALQAICASDKDLTLDSALGEYSPRLQGTPYETVTIRHALKMQSGLGKDFTNKQRVKMFRSFLAKKTQPTDWFAKLPKNSKQGQVFAYTANDTNALLVFTEDLTGETLNDRFSKIFLTDAGTEATVYWQLAKNDAAIGAYGLMVTSRDAIRLGRQFLNILETNGCVEKHFNNMFSDDKSDGKYGFQIWSHESVSKDRLNNFHAAGNGGQYLIFDRAAGSVAFIYSVDRKYANSLAIDQYYRIANTNQ